MPSMREGRAALQRCSQRSGADLEGIARGVAVDYVGNRTIPRGAPNHPMTPEYAAKVSEVVARDVAAKKKARVPGADGPACSACIRYACRPLGPCPRRTAPRCA